MSLDHPGTTPPRRAGLTLGPLVGVADSGGPAPAMLDAAAFDHDGERMPATPDRLGHGSAVAEVIRRACPAARIRHAQVFSARPVTSALRVAAAVDWLVAGEAQIIVLALGLGADRAPLREACARAIAAGVALVAASPSTGAPCLPADYPGVIGAAGDARCGWEDISALRPGVFGAWCGSPERGGRGMGGASLGAARIAGHLAAAAFRLGHPPGPQEARALLTAAARFDGPERLPREAAE